MKQYPLSSPLWPTTSYQKHDKVLHGSTMHCHDLEKLARMVIDYNKQKTTTMINKNPSRGLRTMAGYDPRFLNCPKATPRGWVEEIYTFSAGTFGSGGTEEEEEEEEEEEGRFEGAKRRGRDGHGGGVGGRKAGLFLPVP
ncbi:hypothetical protein GUJ93_ZPchr0003g18481 [Zizania palustris]|uniref:Uncharacterized protein n=1 Tax=Zizania palustris TaxID=103762 RepID=A0A8J5SG62_ZIZPA|nr:hypothetical protein GUJ93_ZPchr0003g18481 [Zizania palustris]